MQTFAHILEIATTTLVTASMAWCLFVLFAAISFRIYTRQRLSEFTPAVSILKPVKGLDPGMIEAFRSHCKQNYAGSYELIFGVSSWGVSSGGVSSGGAGTEDDPAVAAVHQLIAEFPSHKISLILCPERLGTNGKVSNLTQMLPHAQHDFLVINDSDIRVSPNYLTRVLRQFAAPGKKPVGMVTALYRGHAAKWTLGSILEVLGIATDFQAGVLASRIVENGMHFGLGSTLAVRREALQAAGGLEALVDQLADDYEMGARIDKAGYSIRLTTEVVETSVPAYTLSEFASHQLRWARTVRDSRRWGYLGLLFTHTLPLAFLNILTSGASFLSLWLFCLAFFLRLGTAMQVGAGILADRQVLANLWLLPIRDAAGFLIWIWSFASNTIHWRGEKFTLKNGKLHKLED
jgi:ceramide glucosyltransferase